MWKLGPVRATASQSRKEGYKRLHLRLLGIHQLLVEEALALPMRPGAAAGRILCIEAPLLLDLRWRHGERAQDVA